MAAERTTTQRGYGAPHRRRRKRTAAIVARGEAFCAAPKCSHPHGRWIAPGEPWHEGHHPFDRGVYIGPCHAACNCNTTLERSKRRPSVKRPAAQAWL
jgi:hypothetical protein